MYAGGPADEVTTSIAADSVLYSQSSMNHGLCDITTSLESTTHQLHHLQTPLQYTSNTHTSQLEAAAISSQATAMPNSQLLDTLSAAGLVVNDNTRPIGVGILDRVDASSPVVAVTTDSLMGSRGVSNMDLRDHHQSIEQAMMSNTISVSNRNLGAVANVSVSVADMESQLSQVLSGLQDAGPLGDLSAVLQQQPHLVQGLSAIAAGELSADPETLRFQFQPDSELDSSRSVSSSRKKHSPKGVYREQDRFLPIHNVSRLMRNAIPKNGKVSKDAKECMQECVSEFVSFITSEASDKCIAEKRKTITGDDILFAMATLGFDNYIEPLRQYLQKYREFTRADKNGSLPTDNSSTIPSTIPSTDPTTEAELTSIAQGLATMPTVPSIPTISSANEQPTTSYTAVFNTVQQQ